MLSYVVIALMYCLVAASEGDRLSNLETVVAEQQVAVQQAHEEIRQLKSQLAGTRVIF